MSCRIFYRGEEFKSVEDFSQTLQNQTLEDASLSIPEFVDVKTRDRFFQNTFNLIKVDERFQVTADQKEALENWGKRFNVPVDLNFKELETVPGEFYFTPIVSENVKTGRFELGAVETVNTNEKQALEVLARLGQVFPNLEYTIVDPQDLKQEEHVINVNDVKSFVRGNKVHLVKGRFTKNIAIEEALHPFVHLFKSEYTDDYNRALEEAQAEFPDLFTKVKNNYSGIEGYTSETVAEEFFTQALAQVFSERDSRSQDSRPTRFVEFVWRFLDRLQDLLLRALELSGFTNNRLFYPAGKTTVGQIAEYLHTTNRELHLKVNDRLVRYSKEENENAKKNLSAQKDEALIRRGIEFKMQQADAQKELLTKIEDKANAKQKETLEKLKTATQKYREQLDSEKEYFEQMGKRMSTSVSVSKFIGSTEFDGDSSIYQKFADFGTFMHNFLEDISEEILLDKSNKPAIDFLTREKFDKALAKHQHSKSAFEIENLSADEMFLQAKQIMQVMLSNFSNGNIVIPEYTVMASYGGPNEVVLGRLDVMVIDQFGKINIVDFKTKKVKTLIQNEDGHQDIAAVHKELATNDAAIDELTGTHPEFANISRTTFDTWNVQLKVYERMLAQSEVPVGDTSIVALLYQTDEDQKYEGGTVYHFNGNFYDLAGGLVIVDGKPYDQFSEVGKKHYEKFNQAVKKSIPVTEEQEEELDKKSKSYFMDFSKEQTMMFVDILENTVANELDRMQKRKSQLFSAKNPDGERMYTDEQIDKLVNNQRIITLKTFQSAAKKITSELNMDDPTNMSALTVSAQMKLLMQTLETDIRALTGITKDIKMEILNQRLDNKLDLGNYTDRYLEVFNNVQSIEETLNFVEGAVANAIDEGTLEADAHIVGLMADLSRQNSVIVADYRNFATDVFAQIILSANTKHGFEKISNEAREALQPDLNRLYERRDKMLAQDKVGKWDLLRLRTMKLLDPVRYQKISQTFSEDEVRKSFAFQQLEDEIRLLEMKIDHGFEYSPEFVTKLINGVTDRNSVSYIGRNRKSVAGFNSDSWIASASNSDMGISGVANYLKIATESAKDNFMDFMQENDFQNIKDDFSEGRTMKEMNEMITERRERLIADEEGNILDEKRKSSLSFVSPVSQNHEQKVQEFDIRLRTLGRKIDELKGQINIQFLDLVRFDRENRMRLLTQYPQYKELIDLYTQRDELYRDKRNYMREHTHLEFVDEYYEIYDLPSEFLVKINEIKAEELAIQNYLDESSDFSDLESLVRLSPGVRVESVESMVFDRLDELAVEKKKLRLLALKTNPRYAELMDRREQFTNYDKIRWNAFETVKAQKEQEFLNNPEAMQRWKNRNTIVEATQEWHDRMEELREERDSITTQDEKLKDYYDKRRELLAPYRTALGKDYRHIAPAELKALDALEDAINARRKFLSDSKASRLTKGQRKRLKEIRQEISSLQREELNKNYVREKKEMDDMIRKAHANYNRTLRYVETGLERIAERGSQDLQSVTEKAVLNQRIESERANWEHAKTKFSKWYKQYHRTKFDETTGLITEFDLESDRPTYANLRGFVKENVPSQDHHRVERPNNKWRKPEINDSARNPKHQKLPNGLALPKALKLNEDGNVVRDESYTGDMSAVNQKFLEIAGDQKAKAFYDTMMKQYFALQNRTSGNKLGYSVPGKQSTLVQNIMAHKADLAGFAKREIARRIDNSLFRSRSEMDKVTNEFGDDLEQVRFRFNHQFSEDIQSFDAINATFTWMLEAHINEAMNDIKSNVDVALDSIRLMKQQLENNNNGSVEDHNRIKEMQDLYEIIKFERDKHIAGVYEKADMRQLKKIIDTAFGMISFGRLAFSTAGQLKNMFAGNIQSFLASAQSEYFDEEDLVWAKGQLYSRDGFFGQFIADWGKVGNLSRETMMYRKYNPLQVDYSEWLDLTTGSSQLRALEKVSKISELAYFLQDKGDMEIGTTVWLAVMKKMQVPVYEIDTENMTQTQKVNSEGHLETISLFDAYVLDKKGKLVAREDVGDISEYETRVKKIVWSEIRRTQGNYAKSDQTKIEQTLVGRMQMFYRKYLIPQLLNRFGYGREDWEAERYSKGYWRAITNMWRNVGPGEAMKHLLLGFGGLNKIGNSKANSYYARQAVLASRDFYVSVMLTGLSAALLALVRQRKEDDEEIGWLTGNMVQLLWGIRQETTAFTPVPMVMNVDEYIRSVSSYSTAFGDIKKIYKMTNHAFGATVGLFVDEENSEFWSEVLHDHYYQRKNGQFDKGDAKLLKDMYDLTGYKNIDNIFNPEYRISMMMKYQ